MFAQPVDKGTYKRLEQSIDKASKIIVTCHVKPDGDAVGSSLGLWHILSKLGKQCYIVAPDSPPKYLKFLPGFRDILSFSNNEEFAKELFNDADLIFCLDYNAVYRVDKMEDTIRDSKATKVMIDHHLDPEDFVDITISDPQASSTCLLVYKVICQLGLRPLVDKDTATCLAAGMMTDTGNFSYNANNPEEYIIMAQLLECGVDKVGVWDKLNIKSEAQLRLNGFALSQKMTLVTPCVSLITLSSDELHEYNYQKGDLEGLVNVPLQMPDVVVSVLMHQEPGFIKVSMRSQGKIPVNKMCENHFGGGGHLNAAGGEFHGTMSLACETLERILPEYEEYFNKK